MPPAVKKEHLLTFLMKSVICFTPWFRLSDGSHYLFAASSQEEQQKWLKELQNCTNPTMSSDNTG